MSAVRDGGFPSDWGSRRRVLLWVTPVVGCVRGSTWAASVGDGDSPRDVAPAA